MGTTASVGTAHEKFSDYIQSTAKELQYLYPSSLTSDALQALKSFPAVKPGTGLFELPNGASNTLLFLRGGLHINFNSRLYSIPIVVWLALEHPKSEPVVYVEVSTDSFIAKDRPDVDKSGKICLPFFYDWATSQSSLSGLLHALTLQFSTNPPIYSKITGVAKSQEQTQELSPVQSKVIKVNEIFSLTSYQHAKEITMDLLPVFNIFPTLYPLSGTLTLNDGKEIHLLNLSGVLPVIFNDYSYNIPVRIWLPPEYPYFAPIVYVIPTSDMDVEVSEHVDGSGLVNMPYMREWSRPYSDLIDLVQILSVMFGEKPPLFAKAKPVPVLSITPQGNTGQSHGVHSESNEACSSKKDCSESRQCKICMEEEMDAVFFPCTHLVCCHSCAETLILCPICRSKIESKVRIYPA